MENRGEIEAVPTGTKPRHGFATASALPGVCRRCPRWVTSSFRVQFCLGCPKRSRRKWDSHLNTLRQSRVGLRPRDTPQVRAVAQKERRRDDETTYTRGRVRRDGRREGEKGRREKRVQRCSCLSMFSRRSGFAGYTWTTGTAFSFHSRSIVTHAIESSPREFTARGLAMIGLRATRPGPLRFLHCGRDFCRVCRYIL